LDIAKPSIVWTRKHDSDLLLGNFDYGFANYEEILHDPKLVFKDTSQGKFRSNYLTRRLKYLTKCIIQYGKASNFRFDFERTEDVKETKESSGFNLAEKHILYEVLINYGIPVSESDETKEDYQLLQIMFAKYARGEDAETNVGPESVRNLERFI
jgi:hypothetical protein